jgi:hypothetical protein
MADPNGITFMITGALFMLILISEGVHHHYLLLYYCIITIIVLLYYYYYYFRSNHLVGPSPILLEHGAFPNIETCFAMLAPPLPPPKAQEEKLSTMNIFVHPH